MTIEERINMTFSFITKTSKIQLQKEKQWKEFLLAYDTSLEQWIDSYKLWQQSGERALKEHMLESWKKPPKKTT